MQHFRATLEPVPHGGCFVVVPADVVAAARLAYRGRVRGTINDAKYRSSLMKYSGVFHMGVHKAVMAEARVKHGDAVRVAIELDPEPLPADRVPVDLARALRRNKAAAAAFESLAPSHRREHVGFIIEAKKPETRIRRIARTIEVLAEPIIGRPPRRVPADQRCGRPSGRAHACRKCGTDSKEVSPGVYSRSVIIGSTRPTRRAGQ